MSNEVRPCQQCGKPTTAAGGVCTACLHPPCRECGKPTGQSGICSVCDDRLCREAEAPIYRAGFAAGRDYAEVACDIIDLRRSRPDLWPGEGIPWKYPGGVPYSYAEHGLITESQAKRANERYKARLAARKLTQMEAVGEVLRTRGWEVDITMSERTISIYGDGSVRQNRRHRRIALAPPAG